jgi:CheY-like chemotaxis protein
MPAIMVIDDDAINREPTGRLLRQEGYDVIRAANGREGMELLQTCSVDLILLDLAMPEMDGFAFLHALRADARHHSVPVVMLTGLADGQALHRSQKLGASEYLIKSRFTPEKLFAVVRQQLSSMRDDRKDDQKSMIATPTSNTSTDTPTSISSM